MTVQMPLIRTWTKLLLHLPMRWSAAAQNCSIGGGLC